MLLNGCDCQLQRIHTTAIHVQACGMHTYAIWFEVPQSRALQFQINVIQARKNASPAKS